MYRRIYFACFLVIIVGLCIHSRWFLTNTLAAGVDQPPVAVGDSYAGAASRGQSAPGVLANDYDPDGDPMFAFAVTSPSVGQLILYQNGHFNYNPGHTGFTGSVSFTYKVCATAFGTFCGAEASVSLNAVNTLPQIANSGDYVIKR